MGYVSEQRSPDGDTRGRVCAPRRNLACSILLRLHAARARVGCRAVVAGHASIQNPCSRFASSLHDARFSLLPPFTC
jgi:hypothetical protein